RRWLFLPVVRSWTQIEWSLQPRVTSFLPSGEKATERMNCPGSCSRTCSFRPPRTTGCGGASPCAARKGVATPSSVRAGRKLRNMAGILTSFSAAKRLGPLPQALQRCLGVFSDTSARSAFRQPLQDLPRLRGAELLQHFDRPENAQLFGRQGPAGQFLQQLL